jgi:hypothetical protein
MRKEVIGDCTLYLGDCLEVLPTLGAVDVCGDGPALWIATNGREVRARHGWNNQHAMKDKRNKWDECPLARLS